MLPAVDAIEAARLRGSFDRDPATAGPNGDASPPTTGRSSGRDGGGRDGSIVPELVAAYDQGAHYATGMQPCTGSRDDDAPSFVRLHAAEREVST